MENMKIRNCLRENKVRAWELAEGLGIVDCTLSKWMRRELPDEKQAHMIAIIEQIAERKKRTGADTFRYNSKLGTV